MTTAGRALLSVCLGGFSVDGAELMLACTCSSVWNKTNICNITRVLLDALMTLSYLLLTSATLTFESGVCSERCDWLFMREPFRMREHRTDWVKVSQEQTRPHPQTITYSNIVYLPYACLFCNTMLAVILHYSKIEIKMQLDYIACDLHCDQVNFGNKRKAIGHVWEIDTSIFSASAAYLLSTHRVLTGY